MSAATKYFFTSFLFLQTISICLGNWKYKGCDEEIYHPAFRGNGFVAFPPYQGLVFYMEMKIRASNPISNGVIMYSAEDMRGLGGFASIAVNNGKIEFRFDVGNGPKILESSQPLLPDEWTDVKVQRIGEKLTLYVKSIHKEEAMLTGPRAKDYIRWLTPLYIGGYDDMQVTLNKNVGVTGGFHGCIKNPKLRLNDLDFTNGVVSSANVQRCEDKDVPPRGDMQGSSEQVLGNEAFPLNRVCSQCRNGGGCTSAYDTSCTCPTNFDGRYCEIRKFYEVNTCESKPCAHGGNCTVTSNGHKCDCPLGFSGINCLSSIKPTTNAYLKGDGFVTFDRKMLPDDEHVYVALAISTTDHNGILFYQFSGARPYDGDYCLLHLVSGAVVLEYQLGAGKAYLVSMVNVTDAKKHDIVFRLTERESVLDVDSERQRGRNSGVIDRSYTDSDIYIGGVPTINPQHRNEPGFKGCIHQLEIRDPKAVNFARYAKSGRNVMPCSGS